MRTKPGATLLLCGALAASGAFALDGCSSEATDQLNRPASTPSANPSSTATAPPLTDGGPAPTPDASAPPEVIPTWTDAQALTWLEKECVSCHGIDPATGTKTLYHSAWPLEAKGITREYLETSEFTPIAYQTILHRAIDAEGASPSPMPIDKPTPAKRLEMKAVLDWFARAVPFAVIDANARYGNDASSQRKLVVTFKCAKTSSLRTFLSRVTLGALDRPPTQAEFSAFTPAQLSDPVTLAQRQLIVGKLGAEWREEFLTTGLRKLANVIGGAPGIRPRGDVTPAVAADLQQELYQLFLAKYATAPYDEYFTTNTVMASPATAPLYGCTPGADWAPCALTKPRGGFFTTLGFLNSKPQSFLMEANNYGRASALFFTLFGESLLAATDGPSGEATPPLPGCLEATDTRTYLGAPRGSAAVPAFGKLCQSCHISRHMAAGSVLFRPFASTGQLYDPATLGNADAPDKTLFDQATTPEWQYGASGGQKVTVNGPFLNGLLLVAPKACVATGNPKAPFVNVSSVAELAAQLMKNRTSVARGFMRHAHRAYSNVESITLELAYRGTSSFDAGKTKLPELINTYFLSDSLSCEANP